MIIFKLRVCTIFFFTLNLLHLSIILVLIKFIYLVDKYVNLFQNIINNKEKKENKFLDKLIKERNCTCVCVCVCVCVRERERERGGLCRKIWKFVNGREKKKGKKNTAFNI